MSLLANLISVRRDRSHRRRRRRDSWPRSAAVPLECIFSRFYGLVSPSFIQLYHIFIEESSHRLAQLCLSVYLPCRSKCPPHPSWNQGQNWPREGRGARRAREVVNRGREGRRLSRSLPKGEGGGRQGGREGRGRIFMALNQIALLLLLLLFPHFYSPFATVFQLVGPLFTTPEKRPRPKTGWALRSRDK